MGRHQEEAVDREREKVDRPVGDNGSRNGVGEDIRGLEGREEVRAGDHGADQEDLPSERNIPVQREAKDRQQREGQEDVIDMGQDDTDQGDNCEERQGEEGDKELQHSAADRAQVAEDKAPGADNGSVVVVDSASVSAVAVVDGVLLDGRREDSQAAEEAALDNRHDADVNEDVHADAGAGAGVYGYILLHLVVFDV